MAETALEPGCQIAQYQGVQGWLMFFCITLMFIGPTITFYHVFGNTLPMLMRTHDLRREILWSVYIVMFTILAAFGFVTGFRLWLVRRGAVRMAKLFLLLMLCMHVSYFFLWLVLFAQHRTDPVSKVALDHLVGPLVPFCLWSVYLEHSKRVRDTYRKVDRPAET
jgi:hypothetical protein